MVNLTKTISTELDKMARRVVKVLRFGKSDVQTAKQAAPYGVDSNPIKDMIAIYVQSATKGDKVIIGYINKNQLAEVGEHRIFSTDGDGNLATFIWLKNDGTMQIGGDADNAIRYTPLDNELQSFKSSVQAELAKIQTAITALGGSYTPDTLTIDISAAKIAEVKTL